MQKDEKSAPLKTNILIDFYVVVIVQTDDAATEVWAGNPFKGPLKAEILHHSN